MFLGISGVVAVAIERMRQKSKKSVDFRNLDIVILGKRVVLFGGCEERGIWERLFSLLVLA